MPCHRWLSKSIKSSDGICSPPSLSLRSNGFSVILRAAAARTRQVVTHAPFSVSLCCRSIKNLEISLDGTDAARLGRDEDDASQLMSNGKQICRRA